MQSGRDAIVYCEHCGALPGQVTAYCSKSMRLSLTHICVGRNIYGALAHNFLSSEEPVVCEACGTIPENPTTCPGRMRHRFKKISPLKE